MSAQMPSVLIFMLYFAADASRLQDAKGFLPIGHPRPAHPHHARAALQFPLLRPRPRLATSMHAKPGAKTLSDAPETLTERLMRSLPDEEQSGGAGGQSTYEGLLRLDARWHALRNGQLPPASRIVTEELDAPQESPDFDVVVCGGTLGILLAAALQIRGFQVAVVEAGLLRGRNQDWNVARKEIMELVEVGVISLSDLEDVIGIEFNPMRVGFLGGEDIWINDVLNVGVRPSALVAAARRTFEAKGGRVFERTPLQSVVVRPGATVLTVGGRQEPIRARLVLDSMGQQSPIVAQIRDGQKPDGVCAVVGSCASGYPEDLNSFGDVIYMDTPTICSGTGECPTQYFWEAFPASSGPRDRTTYLFTYMDLVPERPSIMDIFEDYWRLLPRYQGVQLEDIQLKRVLYGLFVTYKSSPLAPGFERILQVGDASGIQSPLSFGGLGALTRHIGRLTNAIGSALDADALSKEELALINPYQPNLRAAWLFQSAMRPPFEGKGRLDDDMFIANMMASTFETQQAAGVEVMLPFLQDVLRVDGLVQSIGGLMIRDPVVAARITAKVDPGAIGRWTLDFLAMCILTVLDAGARKTPLKDIISKLPPKLAYQVQRRAEGWQYGAGLDYVPGDISPVTPQVLSKVKVAAALSDKI